MRSMLLVLAMTLAACETENTFPDFGTPDLATQDLEHACASSCGSCASGTTCVTMSGGPTPFGATCLKPCQTNLDCDSTRSCVSFLGEGPTDRHCVTHDEPQSCGEDCDLVSVPSACDGDSLVTQYRGVVCGAQYQHCAAGCVEDAPDGGVGDQQAHCL